MSEEETEVASPEQLLNIASYFVMSSPTGEVHDVLVDVAKLVNDSSTLNDGAIQKIMREYNIEQYQPALTPDGHRLIVSAHGQVGVDEYLDPTSGKVLSFDHRSQKFTGETVKKQALSSNINTFRTAIEKSLEGYMEAQYKKDKCTITVYGADDGLITVCISARNTHLAAYWTGGWRSTFVLNVTDKGSSELKCKTNVNVHYFEEGNVQLHAAIEKVASVQVTDAESTAAAITTAIGHYESEFQAAMEEMYVDMHRTTFKKMRRFLPITKQPMNWNVHAHNLISGK